MRKLLLVGICALLFGGNVVAQSPGPTVGATAWTVNQWNTFFASLGKKADVNNGRLVNPTITGGSGDFTTFSASGNATVGGTLGVSGAFNAPVSLSTVTATGSTTPRTLAQRAAGCDATGTNCSRFDVKDYGASPSNSGAQNTTAFRAAVTAACAVGNSVVEVGSGSYTVDLTSATPFDLATCFGVSLRGNGSTSTLFATSGSHDFIHAGGTVGPYYQPGDISGFRAYNTGNPASGAGIHLDTVQLMTVRDTNVSGFFINYWLQSNLSVMVSNIMSSGDDTASGASLFVVEKSASGYPTSEIFLTNANLRSTTRGTYTYALNVKHSDGLYVTNSHIGFTSGAAVHLAPVGTTDIVGGISISNTLLDEAGTGLDCAQPGGYANAISGVYLFNVGSNAMTNDGLTLSSCSTLRNVQIQGGLYAASGGRGITITSGSNYTLASINFSQNNQSSGGSPNLYIGGTASHIAETASSFDGSSTSMPNHISIADSADYVAIGTNDYGGSVASDAVIRSSTGTHNPPSLGYTYVGPGDVTPSATAWWGLRGYSVANAIAGSKAINIIRASDSATTDIVILPTGKLDVATATAFCASTTCKVTKAYDQTGNGLDMAQATGANQPTLTLNCLNSMPCLTFAGSHWLANAAAPTVAQPFAISFTAKRTANFSTSQYIFTTNTAASFSYFVTANLLGIYAGGAGPVTSAGTDSAWHVGVANFNSGLGIMNIDNLTPTTGNAGPAGIATNFAWGADTAGGGPLTGQSSELGVWPVGLSLQGMTNGCHNVYTFWATPVAC